MRQVLSAYWRQVGLAFAAAVLLGAAALLMMGELALIGALTAGAAAAITVCFKALAEEGDEFIAFAPFFPEYRCFVESVGANLRVVPAKTEDFQIDFVALEERLSPRTKGVIVNSPNNPSGKVYDAQSVADLASIMRSYGQKTGKKPYKAKSSLTCSLPCSTILTSAALIRKVQAESCFP